MMVDRTIPFYNTILRCDDFGMARPVLPENFSFASYQAGFEKDWARLEYLVGDFDSPEEAEAYFLKTYGADREKLEERGIFLLNPQKQVIGSCLAWSNGSCHTLDWVIIDESYQGKGLGRAMCQEAMCRLAKMEKMPVYLHTQPWSWKAILLYVSLGFRLQKKDTFAQYPNDYEQVIQTLEKVVSAEQLERILQTAQG